MYMYGGRNVHMSALACGGRKRASHSLLLELQPTKPPDMIAGN